MDMPNGRPEMPVALLNAMWARYRSLATPSGMVGATGLSRALDDSALSEEMMDASLRELLAGR